MILGATYPAFVLSGFRPGQDLRLSLHRGSGAVVRKILVVGQFGIAAFLLAGSIVVRDQLMLMDQRDIGLDFNVEVIMVQNYQVWQRYPILRDMLLQDPRIEHVTGMMAPPVTRLPTGAESGLVVGTYWWDHEMEPRPVGLLGGGIDIIDTYRMHLLAGRTFATQQDMEPVCVLNESAVAQMGASTPQDALGLTVSWDTAFYAWNRNAEEVARHRRQRSASKHGTVIGVVRDFHWESMHNRIGPTILFPDREWICWIAVRLHESDRAAALDHLERCWLETVPPLLLESLADRFDSQYRPEQRLGQIINAFAGISIVLTAVGLFSLASLLTRQRTRSIAIRKVFGGSTWSLIRSITGEFTRLAMIGNAIAIPISYLATDWWLDDFAPVDAAKDQRQGPF
ncbi:MAG: FtsX-like permease family protein [Candidatus Latescibacterota bacterium]